MCGHLLLKCQLYRTIPSTCEPGYLERVGCTASWRLTDERIAVFPASEIPTNSTAFLVDFDFVRASRVITVCGVKPVLALPSLIVTVPIKTHERAARPPARMTHKVFGLSRAQVVEM